MHCGVQGVSAILWTETIFAFEITGVSELRINVFDVNGAAAGCYRKAGFYEESREKDVFTFQGEVWGRCHMIKSDKE